VLSQQPNTLALQTALFCGYAQARCNGTTATNAYAAAFDWADSSVVTNSVSVSNTVSNKSRADGRGTRQGSELNQGLRYSPDIYFNDTYGVPGQAPVVYQRIPAVLNMAINSWIKAVFGELILLVRQYTARGYAAVAVHGVLAAALNMAINSWIKAALVKYQEWQSADGAVSRGLCMLPCFQGDSLNTLTSGIV
jgi:type IV secretory pathway TrbD component